MGTEIESSSTILLTGATGLVGGALAHRLLDADWCGRLILPVRSFDKARMLYCGRKPEWERKLQFIESSLENLDLRDIPSVIDYIFHCACITQSAEMVAHPVETADSIVLGTKKILELARNTQVRSMVYLSSMEVYGVVGDTGCLTEEDQLGDIDLRSVRSCYPMAKRMAEHYCILYQREYGLPVKIARLAQTFDKGVRPDDQRVYMQFARAVMQERDIVLHTQGRSIGNYCHLQDAVDAVLCILQKGTDGESYNVVNEENTMSIREMAQLVAGELAKGKIRVIYEMDAANEHGYAADTGLRLSAAKLRKLGWRPKKNLLTMYREVLESVQDLR